MTWNTLLTKISKTLQQSDDLLEDFKGEDCGFLGFPPADDQQILKAEERLGIELPPSYKAFLKVSNGFKQLSCFVWDILPVEKIDWLKSFDQNLYNVYTRHTDGINASDADYFVYGDKQLSTNFRAEYLLKSLVVSNWGDASLLLLNPEVKFDQECEAWMFATWNLGPRRYKSFEDLFTQEYLSYLNLLSSKE